MNNFKGYFKADANRLRRQVMQLLEEAVELGVVSKEMMEEQEEDLKEPDEFVSDQDIEG